MRIDELTITNFKCFENETFRFNPHFNVIIGKNASGKSSLLDAVARMASSYIYGIDDTFSTHHVDENDIRTIDKNGQQIKQMPVAFSATFSIHGKQKFWSEKSWYNDIEEPLFSEEKRRKEIERRFKNRELQIPDLARADLNESRRPDGHVIFPLIIYYRTNRLWNQKENIDYFKQKEGVFLAYKDCLSGLASSDVFLSWFKTYEDEVKKFKQPLDELFLKLFRNTISSMIPEWTDMEYSFKDDDMMGIFRGEDNQISKLRFKNLSDGYRNIIGMVADMMYRCIQLNPGLKENVLTETEGIVLIDELDLHLHPEWQRNITADLKRIFPKVQFIVTTHSPFIIQSLKKEELIVLDKNFTEDKDPFRKSVEEIAEDEMQVTDVPRSIHFMEMTNLAKEYFTLVKQNDTKDTLRVKINEAKRRLDKLRILYSDDPAYVAMLEVELEKTESNAAGN